MITNYTEKLSYINSGQLWVLVVNLELRVRFESAVLSPEERRRIQADLVEEGRIGGPIEKRFEFEEVIPIPTTLSIFFY